MNSGYFNCYIDLLLHFSFRSPCGPLLTCGFLDTFFPLHFVSFHFNNRKNRIGYVLLSFIIKKKYYKNQLHNEFGEISPNVSRRPTHICPSAGQLLRPARKSRRWLSQAPAAARRLIATPPIRLPLICSNLLCVYPISVAVITRLPLAGSPGTGAGKVTDGNRRWGWRAVGSSIGAWKYGLCT